MAAPFLRADGYVPLTERIVAWLRAPWWLTVTAFAVLPFVHLLLIPALQAAAGIPPIDARDIVQRAPARALNAYLIVLSFWAARRIADRLGDMEQLAAERGGVATPASWLWPPLLIAVAFTLAYGTTVVGGPTPDLGRGLVAYAVDLVLALLIRLPQAAALWTAVLALVAVARAPLDRLPATFPDDRSLGLRPVGQLVLLIFVVLTAALVPSFLGGTNSLADLLSILAVFGAAVIAIVAAMWRLHERMASERERLVAAARERYATAYRIAAAADAPESAGQDLSLATALLAGAESVFAWPFDEGMQRVVAVVVTGVITGLVVRLIFFAFGF